MLSYLHLHLNPLASPDHATPPSRKGNFVQTHHCAFLTSAVLFCVLRYVDGQSIRDVHITYTCLFSGSGCLCLHICWWGIGVKHDKYTSKEVRLIVIWHQGSNVATLGVSTASYYILHRNHGKREGAEGSRCIYLVDLSSHGYLQLRNKV